MNSTNRVINRIFLILVGAILLAIGLAAVAVAVLPGWDTMWRQAAPSIQDTIGRARTVSLAFAGLSHVSWLLLAIPVAAAILIAALVVLIARQGRGHVRFVVERLALSTAAAEGALTVDVAIADDVLRRAFARSRLVTSVSVSAYRVKGRPTLKVTVTPRRGIEPARVVPELERALAEWDALLGQRVPVFAHLTSGVRTALARPARTV